MNFDQTEHIFLLSISKIAVSNKNHIIENKQFIKPVYQLNISEHATETINNILLLLLTIL